MSLPAPSKYTFVIVSFLLGFFSVGPGFALAGGMVIWYVLTERQKALARLPRLQALGPWSLGFTLVGLVFLADVALVFLLGVLTTGMGQ